MRRPISMDKYLCSFKCPFCGDRVEVTAEKHEDSWSTVRGHCDSNTDKICGMEFNFGTYGQGFTLQQMKESVMEVVGMRFIN